ncbi:hypothetical protein F5Y05DRAFT_172102 [Hypoxylon sp. FL0543]|nr:hypothetical protein F5Y05DRAFT_172102 [Hypoxylon sp. FL0543]
MASTPTKPQANGAKIQLNQREIEIIAKAWICIKSLNNGVPKIDSEKLAKIGNYASADSARHVWGPIERKLIAMAKMVKDDPPTPAKPKGRPPKHKNDDDAGEAAGGSPVKKPRGRKVVKRRVKKESDGEDEELGADEA